jgi:hypothetical protein
VGKGSTFGECKSCGAEFRLGPATCPLCGEQVSGGSDWGKPRTRRDEIGEYQDHVRKLRAELRKLRDEDAEAV